MNWDAIGAIGEIIGAAAVVVSLIYLAVQIRAQLQESRLAAIFDISTTYRESITALRDPGLAKLFVRGKDDYEQLEPEEKVQYVSLIQGFLRVWETAYYQHRDSRLEDNIYEGIVRQLSALLTLKGGRQVWELRKEFFSEQFRDYVDNIDPTQQKEVTW